MADTRKKHFEIKNPFPVEGLVKVESASQLTNKDMLIIFRSKGDSDTQRRLIQDTVQAIDFNRFQENILEQVAAGAGVYDDIATRDGAPDSSKAGAFSYVRNASADAAIGRNVWALYVYDSGYNLVATEEDVIYSSDVADATLAIASSGTFIQGQTTAGSLKGKTWSKIFDQMLFISNPTKVNNSAVITVTTPAASTIEEGSSITWAMNATYNEGSITNGDLSPGPTLTGPPNNYEFTDPDGTTTNYPTAALAQAHVAINPYVIGIESKQVQVDVSYDAGTGGYTDGSGNPSNIFDPDRVASNIIAIDTVIGRRYAFWDVTGAPGNSVQVRLASNLQFLNASDNGSFNISIPANTPNVWFSVPAGKTITVLYVESSNADVTGTFGSNTFDVINGGGSGSPVSYDTWSTVIGGGGYPVTATYAVTIS